ncbi:NADH-quinone oxidoreductase subunit NuoE [Wolbachia endosymbiont of Cruorifilaria tuberocauda]|uniref:NADH-quinone oxidoreductase subunit NuoE n=1 Tax=Wolbachia endosymbiont of Cruorifilaria tuberocauda TaxID=1812111 RepID=UPI00158F1568|nr:NADH-quinone oxidoreductase subunit NuoE [Wolbachia endosymbiont of Cruorifilaria tuberocauda]QKX01441.1 NADH-quinone oxidoreductase subunit NuoE [Wolbachia endosymbiont of Cruorifilaria tuberocauda]
MKEEENQFSFTSENFKKARKFIKMYPKGREGSAVMSLLYLVQEQCGWISKSAMRYVADMLCIPHIRVYEVANFYTMYNLKPVGKYLVQVCRTTPCWLCSSEEVLNTFKRKLGIDVNETTEDNLFTLKEVECLGACISAPVVQINNDFYENLTPQKVADIIGVLTNIR